MKITVLAFAQARDFFGFSETTCELPESVTAAVALDHLAPGWRSALPHARAAVDLEYVPWEAPLRDGQTLAIIPPVSGG